MPLNHLKTTTTTCCPFVGKLFSTQLVPGAKKIGDGSTRGFEPIVEQGRRKKESEVAQLCLTLSDPVDCSPPGSLVHGILQARTGEKVAIPFFRGIFLTQRWNLGLPHCRQILDPPSHQGSIEQSPGKETFLIL